MQVINTLGAVSEEKAQGKALLAATLGILHQWKLHLALSSWASFANGSCIWHSAAQADKSLSQNSGAG